jgi:uncharacterized protein
MDENQMAGSDTTNNKIETTAEPPQAKSDLCERCGETPNELLLQGIALFNRLEFFECHEILEIAWKAERHPIRTVYKGILQIGVGCYHLLRQNYRGAMSKLQSGADYLEPFSPVCMGVDIAALIADARQVHSAVIIAGPDHIQNIDRALLPVIHLISNEMQNVDDDGSYTS